LKNSSEELKGVNIPKYLIPGVFSETVAIEISKVIEKHDLKIWITGTKKQSVEKYSSTFIPSNPKGKLQAKDITRELLLERISGHAPDTTEDTYLLIWDLSDVGELNHFSAIASKYENPRSNKRLKDCVIPRILGSLSHDWEEIQIADVIANFALNYVAIGMFRDADAEKGSAFKKYIYPKLASSYKGINGVGWKMLGL
jgi:hypothetical protein